MNKRPRRSPALNTAHILSFLSADGFVSGEALARRFGVSRAGIRKHIQKLVKNGYHIEVRRTAGYRLVERSEQMLPAEMMHYLPSHGIIAVYPEHHSCLPSTQEYAKEKAVAGAPEGTLVVSETQAAAYGRFKRPWSSPEGGIWFSCILRPAIRPEQVPQLVLVWCGALARAIERETEIALEVKWPNDLYKDGKKVGGIIAEMSAEIGKVAWVVIGVGINANNTISPALTTQATSLSSITGTPVLRSRLLACMWEEFSRDYPQFIADGFKPFYNEYNHRLTLRGKVITVDTGQKVLNGTVNGVDMEGYLLLSTPFGVERILAGDVTICKKKTVS